MGCGSLRCVRRGWRDWGVVEAGNLDDAETALTPTAVSSDDDASPTSAPMQPSATPGRRSAGRRGTPVGLLLNPGR